MTKASPRIYVACLAAYTAGYLHGEWIDATLDPDELAEEIQAMLKESPARGEEFAIHDTDDFCGYDVHEYESLKRVSQIAQLIAEHGEAAAGFLAVGYGEDDELEQAFEDRYCGEWESLAAYAEDLYGDVVNTALKNVERELCGLRPYLQFGYKSMAFAWQANGDYFTVDGKNGVHVFLSRA